MMPKAAHSTKDVWTVFSTRSRSPMPRPRATATLTPLPMPIDRYRTLWGRDYLTDTLCGLELRLSVPSFYQVNHDQAQRLYEKALEYAGLTGRELAVDLYCGAGTITQVLARRARHVIGGEIDPPGAGGRIPGPRRPPGAGGPVRG